MDELPGNDNRHHRGRTRVCGGVRPVSRSVNASGGAELDHPEQIDRAISPGHLARTFSLDVNNTVLQHAVAFLARGHGSFQGDC